MKSIKEKAEEYSFIRQGVGPSGIQYRDFSINKKMGFEAGANYVLEEIEKLVKFNRWAAQDLYELIEQLKK